MNIRQKLASLGVAVPAAAHSYHTENGCLVWLVAAGGGALSNASTLVLTSTQYEAMMMAGLAGNWGWTFEAPYVEPADRSAAARTASVANIG